MQWKKDTTDTLESLPVSDSIMAITDADYFDWPVLPEAPSSLNAVSANGGVKLSWQVHGGDPKHIIVERRENPAAGRGVWQRIAGLDASATDYPDSQVKKRTTALLSRSRFQRSRGLRLLEYCSYFDTLIDVQP